MHPVKELKTLLGFSAKLMSKLPQLAAHVCSLTTHTEIDAFVQSAIGSKNERRNASADAL